jgi:hypothetical protein
MASVFCLDFLRQQFIAALVSRRRHWRGVRSCFPRLITCRVREEFVHQRHQEGFDGVKLGRRDRMVMREIVDDAPRAVILRLPR